MIPGLGRSPEEEKGHPLQYSGLENSMDCIHGGHKESDMTERLSLSLLFSLNALSIEDFISFVSLRVGEVFSPPSKLMGV